jgi:hypothetical protein
VIVDNLVESILSEVKAELFEGGSGSGNWGHKGRPGKRGGSLPTKGKSIMAHILKNQGGAIRIPKVSRKLFRAARTARNVEVLLSGNPLKWLKRLINIFIGRKIAGRFYR